MRVNDVHAVWTRAYIEQDCWSDMDPNTPIELQKCILISDVLCVDSVGITLTSNLMSFVT